MHLNKARERRNLLKKEYNRAIQSNIPQLILETKEKYIESQKNIRELAEVYEAKQQENIIKNFTANETLNTNALWKIRKTLNNNAKTTFYAVKNNSGRRIQCPEEYKQTVKNITKTYFSQEKYTQTTNIGKHK